MSKGTCSKIDDLSSVTNTHDRRRHSQKCPLTFTDVKIQLLKKVFFGPISLKKDLWSFSSSYDALWLMVVSVFVKPNVQWASELTSRVHRCLPLCLTTKFHLQDPHGKKRELTPESYFLISTSVVWHMHHFPQKRININVIEIIKTIKSKMGAG